MHVIPHGKLTFLYSAGDQQCNIAVEIPVFHYEIHPQYALWMFHCYLRFQKGMPEDKLFKIQEVE